MKYIFRIILFLGLSAILNAGSFEKGKTAFLNNKPAEAALYFEQAVNEEPANEDAYMYLGLSYVQNGLAEKAAGVFLKGAEIGGSQEGRFYLNAGNAYLSLNKTDEALTFYNKVIDGNLDEKDKALLNKANILMGREDYADAVDVYKAYLIADPDSQQKEKIMQLISLVENQIAEAERIKKEQAQKLAEAAAEAEKKKQEEEKKKADEAARQKALMDEILNSLSNIGEDTQNIAAGSETIIHSDEESDIDD